MTATVTIPFIDKFRLQGRVGTADIRSAGFSAALTRQLIAAATSQTYDSLLASLRRERDLREARALAQDFVRRAQARYNAGTTPKLDVIRAQVELAQAENDLIANERDVANARAALNRLIGRPLGAPIARGRFAGRAAAAARRSTGSSGRGPGRAARAREPQEPAGGRARRHRRWRASTGFPTSPSASAATTPTRGPGVLFTGGVACRSRCSSGSTRAARSPRRATASASWRRRTATSRRRSARTSVPPTRPRRAALRQAVYIRDQLLPLARQAYRIASVSYGLGGSSALEVLDARRNLLDAESQYTDALAAANRYPRGARARGRHSAGFARDRRQP